MRSEQDAMDAQTLCQCGHPAAEHHRGYRACCHADDDGRHICACGRFQLSDATLPDVIEYCGYLQWQIFSLAAATDNYHISPLDFATWRERGRPTGVPQP